MAWNIRQLHSIAEQRLPPAAVAALEPPLRSVPWKFALCRYHVAEVHRILSEPFDHEPEPDIADAIGKVLMRAAGTVEGRTFAEACFCAEAHMIAFAQALHSTADILAQVLCVALDLDRLFSPKERRRYLGLVIGKMEASNVAPVLTRSARRFLNSGEFRYLRAYVNTTKHHSLVPSRYSIHLLPGEQRHGLKIRAFSNQSDLIPDKWVHDFIGPDFECLSTLFGAIGAELNAYLGARTVPPA